MGMDVYGKRPQSEVGRYFRNNVWYWHPLWDYCRFIAPGITEKVKEGHYNSGDGLDNIDSRKLSFMLTESLNNGVADEYIRLFESDKEPETIPCGCAGYEEPVDCLQCNNTKVIKNYHKLYFIDKENIQSFANFLLECGGFKIL